MREERAFHQFAVLDWRQALPFPGSHTINKSAAEFGQVARPRRSRRLSRSPGTEIDFGLFSTERPLIARRLFLMPQSAVQLSYDPLHCIASLPETKQEVC